MSSTQPSRGFLLPGIGQALVIVAVGCAAWLLCSEFHDRGWIPGVPGPTSNLGNRLRAVDALVQRGREGIPELVEAFSDADPKTRRLAIAGLGRIGPQAGEVLGLVRKALADEDIEVRQNAISAFWNISQDAETAAPIIGRMMTDSNSDVRESAARTLEIIGLEAVGPAIELSQSDSAAVRKRALRVLLNLRAFAPKEKIDAAVQRLLNDPDRDIHIEALSQVVGWGQGSLADICELLHAESTTFVLPNSTQYARFGAVETALLAVVRLGADAAVLLPEIMAVLDRLGSLEVSRSARIVMMGQARQIQVFEPHPQLPLILNALGSMKLAAKAAVPTLLRRLDELHLTNRLYIAETLVEIGAEADQTIPLLVPYLNAAAGIAENEPAFVRGTTKRAATVLVRASPQEARRQVSILIPQLKSAEGRINNEVVYALWGLAPVAGEAVPALIGLVPNSDGQVAWHAIATLGEMGAEAAPAVPALIAALSAGPGDGEVRERIIEALGKIGPAAKTAFPVLVSVIDDPSRFVRPDPRSNMDWTTQLQLYALSAVGRIGETTPQALASVRAQLWAENDEVQVAAIKALALLAGDAPEYLADLVRLLADEQPTVRGQAALAIGGLPFDRHEAVEGLIQNLADENPYVRTAAAVGLGKIGPAAKVALPALRKMRGRLGGSLPLWRHQPAGWKQGMPLFQQISELNKLTIDEAVETAITEVEAGPIGEI